MAGDVKVPGAGKMSKKALVFVLGGSAAVLAFLWYRKRQSSAASTTASTTAAADPNAIDPATGLPYSQESGYDPNAIDPATGIPYSQEYGAGYSSGIDPNTGLPYSQELGGGYYDPNTGQYVYPGTSGSGGGSFPQQPAPAVAPVATITTNAEWAQAAESYLSGIGVDAVTLSAALGKYLTARAVTPAEQALIDQAIAAQGYPPVSGPNGYPPAIMSQPSGGQGGGGGGGGVTGKVTVPHVTGERVNAAIAALDKAGLKAVTITSRNPAKTYDVSSQNPAAGAKVTRGTTVHLGIKER